MLKRRPIRPPMIMAQTLIIVPSPIILLLHFLRITAVNIETLYNSLRGCRKSAQMFFRASTLPGYVLEWAERHDRKSEKRIRSKARRDARTTTGKF